MKKLVLAALLLAPALARADRPLTLDEALKEAADNQPLLREAHAQTEVANFRAREALAPQLPQVNASGLFRIGTNNVPSNGNNAAAAQVGLSSATDYSLGVTASQNIWDFEQTWGRYKAAQASARSQADTEQAQRVTVAYNVRTAYFTARAQKDLIDVAQATLKNQQAHLDQVEGFVQVGTQPAIALAQQKASVANARVQLITAQNNYASAKAKLSQSMGLDRAPDYEVVDTQLDPVAGEDGPLDALVDQAVKARPESAAYDQQLDAQDLTIRAIRGAYYPSLSAQVGATLAGTQLAHLEPNMSGQLNLNWSIYSGGLTDAQVQEAEAQRTLIQAEYDVFKQAVRLDVEQAQLAVHAARETLVASQEAVVAANDELKLAEGRYQAGVGSIIELGDAQVAATTAQAQAVSATYTLANARAQLIAALGKP